MGLTPRGTLPSMRPAFALGRNFVGRPQALVGANLATGRARRRELDERNLSAHLRELKLQVTRSSRTRSHDDVYRDHDHSYRSARPWCRYSGGGDDKPMPPLRRSPRKTIPPRSLPKTRWQAATPMKHRFFKDNGRFITDTSCLR